MKKLLTKIPGYLLILLPTVAYFISRYASRLLMDIFHILSNGWLLEYDYTMYNLLHAVFAIGMAIPMLLYFRKHDITSPKFESIDNPLTFIKILSYVLIMFAIYEIIETNLIEYLYKLFPETGEADQIYQNNRVAKFQTQWFTYLYVGIIVPLLEELYFRKLTVCIAGRRIQNPFVIILIESLIFMSMHSYSVPGLFIVLLSGIYLGSLYYFTGSLWFSILTHSLTNLVCIFATTYVKLYSVLLWIYLAGCLLFLICQIINRLHKPKSGTVEEN